MRPPTLKSVKELAAQNPHGKRIKYVGGCRCDLCRKAATRYDGIRINEARNGRGNPLVSAAPARRHLLKLRRRNIGRRTVHELTGVPENTISKVTNGRKKFLRKKNEDKILSVSLETLPKPHALVKAGPTWAMIDRLIAEGFTKTELNRRLFGASRPLQIGKEWILAATARKVRKLYNSIMIGG